MKFYDSFNEMFSASCSASHLSVFNDCSEANRIYTPKSSAVLYFGKDEEFENAIVIAWRPKYKRFSDGTPVRGTVTTYVFEGTSKDPRVAFKQAADEAGKYFDALLVAKDNGSIGSVANDVKDAAVRAIPNAGNQNVDEQYEELIKEGTGVEGDFATEPGMTFYSTIDDTPGITQGNVGVGPTRGPDKIFSGYPKNWTEPSKATLKKKKIGSLSSDVPKYDYGINF